MITIVLPAVAVVLAFLAPAAESTQLTVVEGSPLELQCVGGFNLDWVFDGEFLNFSGGSSCGGYCSLSHNSLVFRAVLRQHQGGYACVPATVTYNVVVIVLPVVALNEPDDQSLRTGGALNLTYSLLEGGVATAVRWYKDAQPLPVGGRVSVSGQSLLVQPLERGDAGEYSVEVDNGAGTGSAAARVSVKFPPEVAPITAMPTSLVTPTINVTLVCTIVSNPEVESVHWTSAVEGRAPSTVDEESRVSESGHYGQVTTTSTVVVLARGAEEQYTYTCSASNALGEDQANVTVREGVVPSAPAGVRVSAANSTTLTLRWDIPIQPPRVETYVIELRRGQGEWAEARTVQGDTYSVTLEQLLPNTLYQVRVAARNQAGSGVSEAITASTAHQAPFLAPNSVVAQWNQTRTAVELSWRPPSGAVIEGYSVVARLLNSTVVQAVNVSAPHLSLSTLIRGTSYSFEVAAYNSGGEGPKASVTYAVPPVRIAPVVSVVRLTPSSFSLSWPRPADASELSQYHVTVVESASAEQWKAVVDRTAVSHCFTGLLSGRAYRVALTALYIDGSSMSSGHQDIPKEGGGRGDNGCLAIIPDTALPTAPSSPGMTPVIAGVVMGVVGVAVTFVLVTVIVASVVCARWRGWRTRRLDLDNSSSGSNSRMTAGGSSPRPNSPQLKSILVYNSAKDSTRLQYYDVDSIFGTLSDSDKAHSQIVGFEV